MCVGEGDGQQNQEGPWSVWDMLILLCSNQDLSLQADHFNQIYVNDYFNSLGRIIGAF